MNNDPFSDKDIVESWRKNVEPWTAAVRDGQIESRKQATNQSIIDAVLSCSPSSVLDIGCGEGWLVREMCARQIPAMGVDAITDFIKVAQHAVDGEFRAVSYDEIAAGKLDISVHVAVCNFSLLGRESVEGLFRAIPSLLESHGVLIVQTLHPVMACGSLPYQDGWRAGTWAGFSADFTDPAPWYFRTMDSWISLFTECGFRLREVREPVNPQTLKPASVIFIAEKMKDNVAAQVSQ
ncbi:MAG TPA: class I SAM-dependent methyltransferase [Pseudomonadales bacterium]|nr:class I SAM-dependent methyltransferase [Pseudomonadales bacterium]